MKKLLALAVAAANVTACTNLSAVQSLSSRLTGAAKTWGVVHNDYEGSCRRMLQINPDVVDCVEVAEATQALASTTKVLSGYFKALNDAANEQNFNVQPGLGALGASAMKVPGANPEQIKAVSELAGLISRLALGSYRERTLRALIDEGGPPALRVIDLLDENVPETMDATLSLERDQLTGQFASYIQQGGGAVSEPDKLCQNGPKTSQFPNMGANFLLALEYCRRAENLTAKQRALEDYGQSLDGAKKAIEELMSAETRLDSKELASRLYKTSKGIDETVDALNKAFSKGSEA